MECNCGTVISEDIYQYSSYYRCYNCAISLELYHPSNRAIIVMYSPNGERNIIEIENYFDYYQITEFIRNDKVKEIFQNICFI